MRLRILGRGVATLDGADLTAAALLERADEALYRAKKAGRNTARSAAAPDPDAILLRRRARARAGLAS